jgi:phosphopantothenate---cysteine ligase (CTP)
MRILVTAGNTQTPIDRVRCITNVFTGRTGATIAATAAARGYAVTLITSHPDAVPAGTDLRVEGYRTFEDLETRLASALPGGGFDAIVHAAAVNDYHVVGTYAKIDGEFVDVSAGKVKGNHAELWLRMTPAPKLVDRFRSPWGFAGTLVKFKLEVGASDAELLAIAERSRVHSSADLMVANTLEGMHDWAFVGAGAAYDKVPRAVLAARVVDELEARR